MSMKVAIIGSGISGLTSAYLLSQKHQVTVYEADDRIGGHTATKEVEWGGKSYAIDTGFIVFNDWTYPHFKTLLKQLNVPYQPTEMGFSVANERSGLEYSGTNLDSMFAQRKNILSVRHWKMIRDILRFNKTAVADVESGRFSGDIKLGEYLSISHYSQGFVEDYLIPMGAAIWSASTLAMRDFPLAFFVQFFKNHGLLSVNDRPQWHVIKGGSSAYLGPLTERFESAIQLNSPVTAIARHADKVSVTVAGQAAVEYDHVIIAAHSDQALAMLSDPSEAERSVLGSIDYQPNEVVLHTDHTVLPQKRKAWSSWNYRIPAAEQSLPILTYSMNMLQNIKAPVEFCVTLNDTARIDPEKILDTYHYAHPVFTENVVKAQAQWSDINGQQRTWYCGAYWGNGFHEDGVKSALKVAQEFGITL